MFIRELHRQLIDVFLPSLDSDALLHTKRSRGKLKAEKNGRQYQADGRYNGKTNILNCTLFKLDIFAPLDNDKL